VPLGGAAGLHALELASRLGIRRLLVPPDPGVLSAYGMLVSPVRKDMSRTVLLGPEAAERVDAAYAELEAEARDAMASEGVPPADVAVRRLADVRYHGQSFELRVPADGWVDAFHDAHEARFGYARRDARVELVTARVEAVGTAETVPAGMPGSGPGAPHANDPGPAGPSREIRVRYRGEDVPARSVPRSTLGEGDVLEGPAVVHEYSATLWLPPGWRGERLATGAIRVTSS
ncbi:MAG: hydantoinase/oxoprolinase family protein, partial [Gemmatimonadota bacterium]